MRTLILTLIVLVWAGMCVGQDEPPPDPCVVGGYEDEDLELCRDWQAAEEQKSALLKQQQDWNNSAANVRRQHYADRIQKWQIKLTSIVDKPEIVAHIEAKIAELERLRDNYDSTEEGSARDEASKLGPKISELSQLIGQLKEQLGVE